MLASDSGLYAQVDTNRCQMLFEGNEEEYDDFYDYADADAAAGNPSCFLWSILQVMLSLGRYLKQELAKGRQYR